jgi:hypothetical protein
MAFQCVEDKQTERSRWCIKLEETNIMTRTSGLVLGGIVLGSLSVSAWAFPTAPVDSKASSGIILVVDKCGKGNHKDEHGHCAKDDRDHCAQGRRWNEKNGRCEK